MGFVLFFQAEDGIRDLVRSRGLGDVYKRQAWDNVLHDSPGLGYVVATHQQMRMRTGATVFTYYLSLIHI